MRSFVIITIFILIGLPCNLYVLNTQNNRTTKESINVSVNAYQLSPIDLLKEHQLWTELLSEHVSNEGKVNYQGFKKDYNKLLRYIKFLQFYKPNANTSKPETLAYWINAYNALTIDLVVRHYPIKSIKDIKNPWQQRLWKIDEKWINLDDIEHQILRNMNEPRIHFAIVCASVSCPKLLNQAYSEASLEQQLNNATKDFLEDASKNIITENSLVLSKIFKWFESDFTKNGSLTDFLKPYTTVNISEKAKKSYKPYNWDLNE